MFSFPLRRQRPDLCQQMGVELPGKPNTIFVGAALKYSFKAALEVSIYWYNREADVLDVSLPQSLKSPCGHQWGVDGPSECSV